MASPPSSRNDFEIAIVCALAEEYNAVTELVDYFWEDHGYEYGKTREDTNTYTTARIGNSDVVLVLLSGTGKAIACSSVTSLRSSYPGIKLLLLTGICGGVPFVGTEEELLLGDVVISETVIQYDYGRHYPDKFIMKDTVEESLSRPAKSVRNLVAIFKTNRALEKLQQRAAFFLDQIQNKPPGKRSRTNYKYPGTANDRLFAASFRHRHYQLSDCVCRNCHAGSDPVCDKSRKQLCDELGCDEGFPIQRRRLEEKRQLELEGRIKDAQAPFIFVGRIGSGDIVLKSGEDRDRIAKQHSILAFEMEGAGAWDELPCIVIEGVSDYADSHKNNKWQDFAAATAASTMKALLERYTPTDKPLNISLSIQSMQTGPGTAYPERNDDQSRVPVLGVSPHYLPHPNNLRRKSPHGTITDGYDASTTPTALALPPTKYMRGLPPRESGRGSEFLDDTMPYTPVLTARSPAHGIELEGHDDIPSQDNSCVNRFQPTTSHLKGARFNDAIDPDVKQTLVEQLYFSKIDERLTHLTPAQGNTCRWFLSKSEYTNWHNNVKLHDHCGFLWIKGNPGTGKSTLMKFLFETQRSSTRNDPLQILLSFFFLARGTAEEKSTVGLYRSLLHQLFQEVPSLTECLDWMTPDGARVIQRSGWSEEALKQTLKHAAKKLGNISLTMYIDALDECEDSQVARMIPFFEELCDLAGNIRICFSSRHYPHIDTTGAELTLEDEDGHKEDIQKYIKSNLRLGKRNQQTGLLQSEILEKSSGIFLWVVLVIKILTELPDKSIRKMRERLQEIPTELAKLFEMILARDRKNLEQMKICLNWVLFAVRPLKPQELYFAIQLGLDKACSTYWDRNDIDIDSMKTFVKSCSKGLAEVTRNKACEVQFIHESVREFLLSEDGAQWSGASGNLVGHGHQHLRDCCLAQLNASINQHANIPDPLPKPSKELREKIVSKFPFLEYSVLSILQHANSAQHAGIDQQAFLSFFPLERWIFLSNTIERHEIRRYTRTVTLLYILAERDLADLIYIHPHLESWLDVGDERYGPPIFAARATRSHKAVQALLEAQMRTQPAESSVRGLLERCLENADNNPPFSRSFTFSRTKGVTGHVIEAGDEILFKFLQILGKADLAWKVKQHTHLQMLVRAAKNGHEGKVRSLLEMGADINLKDNDGWTPLSWAAANEHEAVIKLLLERGAEVDAKNNDGHTPLSWAASHGHKAVVKLLLERGAEVDAKDNHGRTPLSWAASDGYDAVVRLLLERGAEVDAKDNHGRTPLSWAASDGYDAVVRLLLERGAEVDAKDNHGRTPLSWAASGRGGAIKLLLEYGAEIESKDNNGRTPLSWAASGWGGAIKLLLEYGAEVDTKDNDGRTPLSWAASDGYDAVVRLLLERGAEVDAKDNHGRTPLSWAASGRGGAIKLLLEYGAEIESKDNNGRTPLSWAASGWGGAIKLLLEYGAEVDTKDNDGRTPLSWAASNGYDAVVRLLLERGAEVDAKDNHGRTPLSWAASGWGGAIKLLLEYGAEIESKDNNGRTPLSWAASNVYDAVVKLLLERGAEVDAKDDRGRTPLLQAALQGHEAAVKLLLERGAEVDAKDNDGHTPLSWAAANGHEAVVKLLLDRGAEVDAKGNHGHTPLSWAAANGREAVVKLLLERGADINLKDNYGWTPLSWAATNGHEAVIKLLLADRRANPDSKIKNGRTPFYGPEGRGITMWPGY